MRALLYLGLIFGIHSSTNDVEFRLQVGTAAASNIEVLNDQPAVAEDPEHPFVIAGLTSDSSAGASSKWWYGTVHGVPMLLVDLNEDLKAKKSQLVTWLLQKEVEWSKLPVNEHWPEAEKEQVTSKYRWYNVLEEMLADPAMVATQQALKQIIVDHFFVLQGRFPEVVEGLDNVTRNYWRSKYTRLGEGLPEAAFSLDPSLYIECWLNSHRPTKGLDTLSIHEHGYPWHGYFLLEAAPSNTSYFSPTSHSFFSLKNANDVLVMLPGGIDHAVLSSALPSRVSVAFDLTYGISFRDRVVTHPSVVYPPPVLDDKAANTWMQLLTQSELAGKELFTFDYKRVRDLCEDCPGLQANNWGGVVDIRAILDNTQQQQRVEL